MSDTTDLVQRLRKDKWHVSAVTCEEAADTIEALQAERDALLADAKSLRGALKWYADGEHFNKADPDAWDTVSGEPQNWWCDEAGTATIEDGSLAGMVLAGDLTGEQLHAMEDGEDAARTGSKT